MMVIYQCENLLSLEVEESRKEYVDLTWK